MASPILPKQPTEMVSLNSVQMLSTLPKNVRRSVNGLCSYQDEVNQFYALGELDEGKR